MPTETPLEQALRHTRRAEDAVEQQRARVEQLERDGHADVAQEGRELLTVLENTLQQSRNHLEIERRVAGSRPQ